ncbi:mastermind-like domain-containing protein 1 isoform X2 [Heterocephalus glaber]|uniref:Mastermind-like domain-containing protein 1 isoform X2 n=1 Tax=Heterocephalus glaber TaxID=10181 RepID=A0AAX6SFK6_HETGA|nr:mastermind-like domain-containing protein 1 isoform X2 [Heterocephalus glaber]
MDDWKSRLVIKSMLPHFTRKLQESGPIKRRQEGDDFQFPGMADGGYPNKIKRPCLEDVTLPMGPGAHPSTLCAELQVPTLTMTPSSATVGPAGQSLLLEHNPMNGSVTSSQFGVQPTTEMGLKGPSVPYYEKISSMPAVDQELQDLLEELTKIQEPSLNDLDLEKILGSKPEDPLVLYHTQTPVETPPKLPVQMPQLEGLDSGKEFASSCSQVTGVSLPVLPSSTGISYSIPSTSKQMASPSSSIAQAKNQAMPPVTVPPLPVPQWHHAHQLKALAASKQGCATKQQGPSPTWSGLPPPGLSPPYRPVPSPHPPPPPPPPFSPQSFMVSCMSSSSSSSSTLQGSPNALLSSMASSSNATLGPTLPYAPEKLPSPALSQQPQFSPQSSILANLVSSTIKSPQGHLMSALPTSNPGPSPPYRPEKLSSPGSPQQSFTPQHSLIRSLTPTSNLLGQQQQQQQQQANAIFKPMTSNSSKTLSMLMHQGLASSSPEASEPFTFGNTKPLSHFISEPAPPKMPSMPATSRQASLLHYLQQPLPAQASSATASSTATATLQLQPQPQQQPEHSFLLQQMMQQPQRFQRSVASESMPTLPRQQEKQKSGLMAMTPKQRSAYVAQQMSQVQAVQEQVTSKCSQTKASPSSSQHMMPPSPRLLPNNLTAGAIPPTRHQSCEGMGMISPTPRKQQGTFSTGSHFPTSSRPSKKPLGSLGSVCQHPQSAKAALPGVLLPRFCPSPLGSRPLSPHQLRQPSVPKMPTLLNNGTWVALSVAAVTTAVSREPSPSQVDNSNSGFAKAPMKVPPIAQAFPSQQAVAPPGHVSPGSRSGQKGSGTTLASPSFGLLGSQSLRQSPVRGPVPVLSTKSLQQGMARFAPMSPIHGSEPPSYVAAATAASAMAASQSLGPFNRMGTPPELPPSDFLPQQPLNGLISPPDNGEVDFSEALLKGSGEGPDEDWLCNLRLIDDILEQHAAAQNTRQLPRVPGGFKSELGVLVAF